MRLRSLAFTLLGLSACHLIGGAGDLVFTEDEQPSSSGGSAATASMATSGGAGGGDTGGGAGVGGAGGELPDLPRPSCEGLATTCGASGVESCCDAMEVPGGTFEHLGSTITVSTFRLDRYEVTVGRFRRFVQAVADGWRPAPGSGRHTHVSAIGLTDDLEAGWDPAWTENLPVDAAGWDAMLSCAEYGSSATAYVQWTPSAEGREQRPIGCMTWYAAYAFCVYDGGFLPTEAEWSLAATGGQPSSHAYPWGMAEPSAARAAFGCQSEGCDRDSIHEVGMHPTGAAPFGHEDMAGNLWEWTLDRFTGPFAKTICVDCVVLSSGSTFSVRGGAFVSPPAEMAADARATFALPRGSGIGFRCAAPPRWSQL